MAARLTRLDAATWGAFAIFGTSGVVVAVCLPEISRDLSIGLSEGGGLETARTCVFPVVLILAGLGARRWGKKGLLASGQFVLAAGLLGASLAGSYLALVVSLMLVGAGAAFSEALVNPLVFDLHPEDSGTHLNMTNAFYPIGVMASALLFGELLTLGCSWRFVFRLAAGAAAAVGVAFCISRFPPPAEGARATRSEAARILRAPAFWLFAAAIFLGAGAESALTFWSRSYVAAALGDAPRAGAVAVVIFAGAMAAGRLLAARLTRSLGLRTIMVASAVLGLLAGALLPFAAGLASFYALVAVAGVATACFWPTILAAAAGRLKADPIILFVLLACSGMTGVGVTPLVMGAVGDAAGLRAALAVVPGLFAALMVVLGVEWRTRGGKP